MEYIVIDSSVAIKWFVVEHNSDKAREILDIYKDGAINFIAPDLINAEFGNILWKKYQRNYLNIKEAEEIIEAFQSISFTIISNAKLLKDAYNLATRYNRTVYDMLYVALSERDKCKFVTADERLVNALGSNFQNIVWLAHWSW